jgi:hypothetical protein
MNEGNIRKIIIAVYSGCVGPMAQISTNTGRGVSYLTRARQISLSAVHTIYLQYIGNYDPFEEPLRCVRVFGRAIVNYGYHLSVLVSCLCTSATHYKYILLKPSKHAGNST